MTGAEFNERLQEALCALSARGYVLSGPSYPCAGVVSYLAARLMPDGGAAYLHLDLRVESFDAMPTTSKGSGIEESGKAVDLINRIRSGRTGWVP